MRREVEALCAFQWSTARARLEPVGAADHLVDGAEAQLGHELAHLLGDEAHEVHHVLRARR